METGQLVLTWDEEAEAPQELRGAAWERHQAKVAAKRAERDAAGAELLAMCGTDPPPDVVRAAVDKLNALAAEHRTLARLG